MTFYQLIQNAIEDTLGPSLSAFLPELAVCATIVALLLAGLFGSGRRTAAFPLMLIDTDDKFPELMAYREILARVWKLVMIYGDIAVALAE